jgi:hypothetical protein
MPYDITWIAYEITIFWIVVYNMKFIQMKLLLHTANMVHVHQNDMQFHKIIVAEAL